MKEDLLKAHENALILVVDDLEGFRQMTKILLDHAGYEACVAANGAEALDYLGNHPDISVIILDLNMPVMGGWEFLERQRQDERLAHIPVILCSGEIAPPESRFIGTNVVAFVPKERSLSDLVPAVELAVEQRHAIG